MNNLRCLAETFNNQSDHSGIVTTTSDPITKTKPVRYFINYFSLSLFLSAISISVVLLLFAAFSDSAQRIHYNQWLVWNDVNIVTQPFLQLSGTAFMERRIEI